MSLFVCSKCGCIDNTATSYYWALMKEPVEERISVLLKDRKKKVVSIFYTILIMVVCKAVIL